MNVLYKTKLCNYALAGSCKHGQACLHAHSPDELREPPNFRKTKICRMYLQGVCYNNDCNRAHGRSELRIIDKYYKTKVCKYWKIQGACVRGAECHFAHGDVGVKEAEPRLGAHAGNSKRGASPRVAPLQIRAAPKSLRGSDSGSGSLEVVCEPPEALLHACSSSVTKRAVFEAQHCLLECCGPDPASQEQSIAVPEKYRNATDESCHDKTALPALTHCSEHALLQEDPMLKNPPTTALSTRRKEVCQGHRKTTQVAADLEADMEASSPVDVQSPRADMAREEPNVEESKADTRADTDAEAVAALLAMLSVSLLDSGVSGGGAPCVAPQRRSIRAGNASTTDMSSSEVCVGENLVGVLVGVQNDTKAITPHKTCLDMKCAAEYRGGFDPFLDPVGTSATDTKSSREGGLSLALCPQPHGALTPSYLGGTEIEADTLSGVSGCWARLEGNLRDLDFIADRAPPESGGRDAAGHDPRSGCVPRAVLSSDDDSCLERSSSNYLKWCLGGVQTSRAQDSKSSATNVHGQSGSFALQSPRADSNTSVYELWSPFVSVRDRDRTSLPDGRHSSSDYFSSRGSSEVSSWNALCGTSELRDESSPDILPGSSNPLCFASTSATADLMSSPKTFSSSDGIFAGQYDIVQIQRFSPARC